MRQLLIAGALLLGSIPAQAQESAQLRSCLNKAMTQAAMNVCANEELARADAELNAVYRKLLDIAKDNPKALDSLKAQERAWITYRDAYMEAMYPEKDKRVYGSVFPTSYNLILSSLTMRQTEALKDMLREWAPAAH